MSLSYALFTHKIAEKKENKYKEGNNKKIFNQ